jgi:predicted HD phosphohydrolase
LPDELEVVVTSLDGVFDGEEPVDELSHALQCARHALDARADVELVVAALLHDVARSPIVSALFPDMPHEFAAAAWLLPRFGERVAWVVGAHTVAKVYLIETEPGYAARLSTESRKSAVAQREIPREDFVANRWWPDALQLRRWDDAAKEPGVQLIEIDAMLHLVRPLLLG